MPHSSGGGSHRGGSRSSSHRSSHSSSHRSSGGGSHRGGSSRRPLIVGSDRYDKAPRGYSRYAYYCHSPNGVPYIMYQYVKDKAPKRELYTWLFFYVVILIVGIVMLSWGVEFRRPMDTSSYDAGSLVMDNADVMTDEEEAELCNVMDKFLDKTGISLAVMTDTNEAWEENYDSLENYAYDVYVNNWNDESHWLFVYTQPAEVSGDFVDWYWEGMQGDDTDTLLTSSVTDNFNESLQKYLTADSRYSVAEAFEEAISETTGSIKVKGLVVNYYVISIAVSWGVILLPIILGTLPSCLASIKQNKRIIEDARNRGVKVTVQTFEDVCDYCGGVYIHGVHINCPHCNAPIKPMQYQE